MEETTPRLATRRAVLTGLTGMAALSAAACTSSDTGRDVQTGRAYPADQPVTDEYRQEEIQGAVENFFGVTAQASAEVVERVFGDLGRPNAYIAGEEAAAAVALGLRYGEGWLYRRGQQPRQLFWTGPSLGVDLGINASKVFTLVYDLQRPEQMFQRFPGVEGSYYFIAGMGVHYLRAESITLAPIRTGIGARAGINVGYLNFTPERNWVPL